MKGWNGYDYSKLAYTDFKSSGLWRDAAGHKIRMAHPDAHSRSKAAKIYWSAKTVKNQDVFRYVKAGDG